MRYLQSRSLKVVLSGFGVTITRAMSTKSNEMNRVGKIAVGQLCSTSSKLENLFNVAKCAGWAKRENCSVLFLPECFGFLGESAQQTLKLAEPPITEDGSVKEKNDDFVTRALTKIVSECSQSGEWKASELDASCENPNLLDGLRTVARESNLWISAGGMHVGGAPPAQEDEEAKSRVYNTHVIVDNHGEVQCVYRKIHLFDVSIPGKVNLRESATTAPGTALKVCDSPVGKLGVTVCYDVRFPEMYVELVKQGAQILLVPSAFTVPTGSAHWHTLLKARAIESQCYVIAAAQYGKHNEKRESYGHSLVVDPWGKVLVDAGGYDGPGTCGDSEAKSPPSIYTCDIDLDHLDSIRQRIPVQMHRSNASIK